MKINRIIAAVLSLCMVGGAFTFNAPAISDYSITADAAGECYLYNSTTGLLTLKGNIVYDEIANFEHKEDVKKIKVNEGIVLPENCEQLFAGYFSCTSIDLSNADTSNVTNMSSMFSGCSSLTSLDLSSFDTSKVTDMTYMFYNCLNLTSLDISGFDTRNVTDMHFMFMGCTSLTSLELRNFDTSKVTNMNGMFSECKALTLLDLSGFDTKNVTNMGNMFMSCYKLTTVNLSGFDTSNVSYMGGMFFNCKALKSLDLSSFDTSIVESAGGLFGVCTELSLLTLGKDFGDITEEYGLLNKEGWVNTNDPTTIISGSGTLAEFTNIGMNTYVQFGTSINKNGDVNCDGEITIADAVLLQKWLLGVPNTHLPYWQNADLCEDEVIDAFDLCLLKTTIINQK